jgi:hypothetical protein
MTNLIETMARAMWGNLPSSLPWDVLDAEDQDYFRRKAHAALSAIEAAGYRVVPVQPTPDMLFELYDREIPRGLTPTYSPPHRR